MQISLWGSNIMSWLLCFTFCLQIKKLEKNNLVHKFRSRFRLSNKILDALNIYMNTFLLFLFSSYWTQVLFLLHFSSYTSPTYYCMLVHLYPRTLHLKYVFLSYYNIHIYKISWQEQHFNYQQIEPYNV